MLARSNRLARGRDIARVITRGQWGGRGILTVKAIHTGAAESRAVVVVSKKVSKKATQRNRIRRRIGALLAQEWETVTPGYDIVITVREDVAEMPASDLLEQLMQAAKQARVIKSQ